MTFKIDHGEGIFHCDTCPSHIECDGRSDFTGSLIYAKSKGWRTYKGPDKQWAHACPSCTAEYAREQCR
jgi:hypothetical protein